MENSPLTNPSSTDLRDEALRRSKKKYKKRRSEASSEQAMVDESYEVLQEEGAPDSPSATVPLKGEWTEVEAGDDNIMFDDSVSGAEDGEDPSQAAFESPSNPTFGPWMIVQGKTRLPVKEMVDMGKTIVAPNQGHDSRNRFHSLQGVKEDSREKSRDYIVDSKEKIKETVVENNSKMNGASGYGRKVSKPEKDMRVKSKEDGLPKTIVNSGSEVDMSLPFDAISLPPQQPSSVVSEAATPNMLHLVNDGKEADVSARTKRAFRFQAMWRDEHGFDAIMMDQDELKQLVVVYYKDLLSVGNGEVRPLVPISQPVLSLDEKINLQKGISFNEVRCALFKMKPWKAPKVDGFQAGVYQAYWDDFCASLFKLVTDAFDSAETIRPVLDSFCLASGAKVSLEKSRMWISPKASGVGCVLYRELIDKVNTRLSGWKSKLPVSCRNNLDMLNRRILWGGTESKRALQLVKWNEFHSLGDLLMDIKEMLRWDWQCHYKHTLREGNFCADKLSKMGCELDADFEVYHAPPLEVVDAFRVDRQSVAFPRGFKLS
ncbi:hypothetical protein COLO4_36419 [Corchorus olitorius]|uniref:RNase H type-1 domain-containing protein n=1 Tax=Corchorus olitorius TaxID=93759 RepID=A0A1R3G8Z3_9ROSI|nr:hypothetical protein COLO4_36419 [Corchorus olitorius]